MREQRRKRRRARPTQRKSSPTSSSRSNPDHPLSQARSWTGRIRTGRTLRLGTTPFNSPGQPRHLHQLQRPVRRCMGSRSHHRHTSKLRPRGWA